MINFFRSCNSLIIPWMFRYITNDDIFKINNFNNRGFKSGKLFNML